MTLGEYKVGIDFNPGGNPQVNEIKRMAAELIDYLEAIRRTAANTEVMVLAGRAQQYIEDAAMWGVKAVTKPTPPDGLGYPDFKPTASAPPGS